MVLGVYCAFAYFRGHKLWGTTKRACCLTKPHLLFAQTIISNFHVAIQGQQNVVELEVTGQLVISIWTIARFKL